MGYEITEEFAENHAGRNKSKQLTAFPCSEYRLMGLVAEMKLDFVPV